MYLIFSFIMFLSGGGDGADDPCRVVPARACRSYSRSFFKPAHHHAWPCHGVRCHHAGLRRLCELDDPADDRRIRHGFRPDEQLELLAPAACSTPALSAPSSFLVEPLPRAGRSMPRSPCRWAWAWTWQSSRSISWAISSIMGAINIVVTILNMRAPGMTLMKMPLFCWTWLITAYLLIAVMPVLAGAVTMILTDRHFGTSFFQRCRRRRSGSLPTRILVLRASRGLHHDPARFRHRVADHSHLRSQATIWLRVDGLCHRLHRDFCPSSCGRTTCSSPACQPRRNSSSCTPPC